MDASKIYIVIPAKEEGSRIGAVLERVLHNGYSNIVVVNDGSEDNTGEVAQQYGAIVLNHIVNLGVGAATQTGIEYALRQGAEIIVTLDGDHQHLPQDIGKLVSALVEMKVDLVIGSRFFGNNTEIPTTRVIYNKIGNLVTWLFTGLWVSDSQSGMKAFSAGFARRATITRNGYEFCIEIIKHARLMKASLHETPIAVVYTKDTMSKGQGLLTGVKMVLRLLKPVL